MKCGAADSPAFVVSPTLHAPDKSALGASASSCSTASAWSDNDAASQSSDDTSASSANTFDSDSCDRYCTPERAVAGTFVETTALGLARPLAARDISVPVPPGLRQNPRRTAPGSQARPAAPPPPLVRQADRRHNFVDNLVDSSTQIVEAIWPLSSVACRIEPTVKAAVLPLRTFIQETLRRSRTSYSTLQVALYYLILVKPHVPRRRISTEPTDDHYSERALQCGRRMFLAALILASKYLQDRNYSSRAWSKISGLHTHEINQNEIAFLLAVNWRLHIADDVFQRWTEVVLKFTPPPSPPSTGGVSSVFAQQAASWKHFILRLDPDLANIEGLLAQAAPPKASDLCVLSPRSILNASRHACPAFDASIAAPAPRACHAPAFMEPQPTSACPMKHPAPVPGLVPTPCLTPQTGRLYTPAASAAPQMMGRNGAGAMAMAMAQAASCAANTTQSMDRFPGSLSSSPQAYCSTRRSSLARSVSTASSPESMVSDTSRSSRSSSISSASSFASATACTSSGRCSLPLRSRMSRLWGDRACVRPTVASVPEDYSEHILSSSPESYAGPVAKLGGLSLETRLARRESQLDYMAGDPATDAARALQDLHRQASSANATPTAQAGRKRSWASSTEAPLQDNVRDVFTGGRHEPAQGGLHASLLLPGLMVPEPHPQFAARPTIGDSGKRVCCSAEAANDYLTNRIHPAISLRGPGMWDGILN